MTTIAITGCSGFLGRRVVEQAIARGFSVRCIARRPCGTKGAHVSADLTQPEAVGGAFDGVEAVVHAAGLAHQRDDAGVDFHRSNVAAVRHVVEAAAKSRVRRLILVSSVSVYAKSSGARDEQALCEPGSRYGLSKLEGERAAIAAASQASLFLVILRVPTLFGEEDPGNVVRLIAAICKRRFIQIGDGGNRKTLLHADDAATAVLGALTPPQSEKVQTFNVGGLAVPISDLVRQIASACGQRFVLRAPSAPILFGLRFARWLAPRNGFLARLEATVMKWLEEDLFDGRAFAAWSGFVPTIDIATALHREIAWWRSRSRTNT